MPLTKRRRTLAGFLALTVGLIALSGFSLLQAEFRRLETRFTEQVRSISGAVRNQLDTNDAVLAGFAAFLQAVDQSDQNAAVRYAEVALRGYPHIYMLEVARGVPVSEERQFESLLRRTWQSDFELKAFPFISNQSVQVQVPLNKTWPVLFMYPQLPQASAIYGVRLETVPYLSYALAKSQTTPRPLASPVFSMYEGGDAYIMLQSVSRQAELAQPTGPNFFGSSMVALLLIKTESLLNAVHQVDSDPLVKVDAVLNNPSGLPTPVISIPASEASWLERMLMVTLREKIEVDSTSQPMTMSFERQLRFSDVFSLGTLAIIAAFFIGIITIPLILIRHFAAIHRAEVEHARATFLASHDLLTQLPNRYLLAERFDEALAMWTVSRDPFAVLLIDLDHFKKINDQYGHAVGDQVLQAVSVRMSNVMGPNDTLARYGGDEFVALVRDVARSDAANTVATNMLYALQQPVLTTAGMLSLSCSIGVAICPTHGKDLETLFKAADSAMYDVKQVGKNGLAMSSD
jgi:diguanylate cyclase (GGDEF)-like protein